MSKQSIAVAHIIKTSCGVRDKALFITSTIKRDGAYALICQASEILTLVKQGKTKDRVSRPTCHKAGLNTAYSIYGTGGIFYLSAYSSANTGYVCGVGSVV